MFHLALPVLLLNCMEVKSQCLQDLSSPIIHHHDRGRHCCWRCNGRQCCSRRSAEDSPYHDGLAHGICEAAKALDKHQVHLCVLTSSCDEPTYVKLVEALCGEHQINLIEVDDINRLGERVSLYKIDWKGSHGKWLITVRDYGAESLAKYVIKDYFKCKKWINKYFCSLKNASLFSHSY